MRIFRLAFLLPIILLCGLEPAAAAAPVYEYEYEEAPEEVAPIPMLNSLEDAANAARASGVPILVEFSTPWCRYCEALEQQILKPLILNGKYANRLILGKLEVTTYSSITGFDGRKYRTDRVSRQYGVDLYPTLVFFDANGREVSRRIVGITVLEYVAGELEKAIEQALKEVAAPL